MDRESPRSTELMNTQEKRAFVSMRADMEFDVKSVNSFLDNKGGLTVEAFIDRVSIRARDIQQIINGTYPWEPIK